MEQRYGTPSDLQTISSWFKHHMVIVSNRSTSAIISIQMSHSLLSGKVFLHAFPHVRLVFVSKTRVTIMNVKHHGGLGYIPIFGNSRGQRTRQRYYTRVFTNSARGVFRVCNTSFFIKFMNIIHTIRLVSGCEDHVRHVCVFFSIVIPFHAPRPSDFNVRTYDGIHRIRVPVPSLLIHRQCTNYKYFKGHHPDKWLTMTKSQRSGAMGTPHDDPRHHSNHTLQVNQATRGLNVVFMRTSFNFPGKDRPTLDQMTTTPVRTCHGKFLQQSRHVSGRTKLGVLFSRQVVSLTNPTSGGCGRCQGTTRRICLVFVVGLSPLQLSKLRSSW